MARERTITRIELVPAEVSGDKRWIEARWERSDGSKGRATAYFRLKTAERWYIAQLLVSLPTGELLRDIPLARIEAAVNADQDVRAWLEKGAPVERNPKGQLVARRHRLKRPPGRRLDDAFYARVATAYMGAVAHGLNPAKTLAEDSDTPQSTVNRWIATAGDKGMLPETTPGKLRVWSDA